jgi:uncharacterized protein
MKLQTVHWRMPNGLEFEWDPAKAASNLHDHRVSFPYAARVFLDPHRQEQLDTRADYGEERWIVLGRVDEWILAVVYTLRGSDIRLISARKADRSDYGIYWH